MSDAGLRREIIETCVELQERGLIVGTYGNVSGRCGANFLITPSRVAYREMQPADLVEVDLDGVVVSGERLPSSEMDVHRLVYRERPDAHAVVHSHSFHATAASTLNEPIPVILEEQSQVIGGPVPCTSYVPAGRHRDLGEEIRRALGPGNAVLLANHGLICFGGSLPEALFANIIAERVCAMFLLARAAGTPTTIPEEHVASERYRYLHKYGTSGDREEA